MGSFVANVDYRDLPADKRETIERTFLDTTGGTLAGMAAAAVPAVTASSGPDPETVETASLLGIDTEADPASTALWVGTASHALDSDDLWWAMDGQPNVTLERRDSGGRDHGGRGSVTQGTLETATHDHTVVTARKNVTPIGDKP